MGANSRLLRLPDHILEIQGWMGNSATMGYEYRISAHFEHFRLLSCCLHCLKICLNKGVNNIISFNRRLKE